MQCFSSPVEAPLTPAAVPAIPSPLAVAQAAAANAANAARNLKAPVLSTKAKIAVAVLAGILGLALLLLLLLSLCRRPAGVVAMLPPPVSVKSMSTQTPAVADVIIPPSAPEPFKVRVFRPQFCEREEEFDEKWAQTKVLPHYNV
jgi:hypothetical protein